MAKKAKTVFVCQECGYESAKWQGQCICGAWNSMVEEKVLPASDAQDKRRRTGTIKGAAESGQAGKIKNRPSKLSQVESGSYTRMDTGIGELNRVLGGGMVKGSLTLISGEPGIGKSTIIIQAAANIAKKYGRVLYVSGEESEDQIKMRADRVCKELTDNLFILAETNMENISAIAEELKPEFVIIDSIQTMYSSDLDSAPGSVSQVRACGNELMRVGKTYNIPIFIVAHVTKSGELAGPKIVEHLVDCVLHFNGERYQELRILRAFKNRFGTTSEIGAFEMAEEGLIEIENLSKSFLEGMEDGAEGSMAAAVYEGTRPLLLEVQALAAPTNVGFARRSSIGVELSRLNMILAVLERKAGLNLINQDIYVNVVGGLKPEGTSIDLAVALAIYSTVRGKPCSGKTIALGEIGLTGDLRSVQNSEKIVREAARMGFERIILPKKNADRLSELDLKGMRLTGVKHIIDAIKMF
ncbi:DNA repair protein RadA [Ihubacter massiliensis]|uniref:DNA repair protein RadA n=1 Tax=Hominibacterium faecale TaxID=2839743 RepID=A0A9J6QNI2_9FIRM|nr:MULTISPECIES: DNA repair protein RadA [Eubacteriales Family XIII. Incertae Sedis]MCO7122706.1 DNA repair protein RadA [Ihubacter massiliensis]MCU7376980.1 DNA repair protein RadA [Hominibacterium faecale]